MLQDYETELAAYSSGLETLLSIPIKRTMLKSPTVDLNQEVAYQRRSMSAGKSSHSYRSLSQAVELQTRYVALLTTSADSHRFLGDLLKHMEELKVRLMASPESLM